MTITTLIPTKNRSRLLRRAIISVQNQKYKDVKICVRDNSSTDDTRDVLREIQHEDSRIMYTLMPKDIGPHENFRQGLKNIETEYFSILSDDDYLHEDFYINGIDLLERNPNAAFVVFSVDIVDAQQNLLFNNSLNGNDGMVTYYSPYEGIQAYIQNKIPYTWIGYIFRKKVSQEIDLGDFCDVGYGADIRFIWHAACRFDFIVSGQKGAFFTTHKNSTSNTLVKIFDERFKFWWRNRISLITADPSVQKSVKDLLWNFYFKSTRKKYNDKYLYFSEASKLISMRLKSKDYLQLKLDYISMNVFLPGYIVLILRYVYAPLEVYGLMTLLRHRIKNLRKKSTFNAANF